MFKNVASQKVALFAFDTTTGVPKSGDGANITPYVSKDYGAVTVLGTTTATEMDATNAKGWYSFVLTQGESNADALLFTGKSTTANISIVGALIFTTPPNFSTLVIDGSGRGDISKIGGTAQTAGDIFARIGAPAGASIAADLAEIEGETDTLLAGVVVTTNNDKTGYGVTSNVKKNQALAGFTFIMTDSTTHVPKTGVTVTAQRSLDGGALGACANSVTEISNGLYTINLAAADLNANVVMLRFTGASSDDRPIVIVTQP